jgi:glutamate carboxypeptidase
MAERNLVELEDSAGKRGAMTVNPQSLSIVDLCRLHAWLEDHLDAMVEDLATCTGKETPSTDKALLDAGAEWLTSWLTRRLGQPEAFRRASGGQYGDILISDYAGAGPERVLLLGHYDTVWEAGTLTDWPFRENNGVASGPGVFDMKAGLVQAIWALCALEALELPRPPVRLLVNGDEEIGSPASRELIEQSGRAAAATFVFEPSANGALKTARKGVGMWRIVATGEEAHAGLDPATGASAVAGLAEVVLGLHELADPDLGTTVNVGTFHGGTRGNVIAGRAQCEVDVRVASQAEAQRVHHALGTLSPSDPRVSITWHGGWNRPVMERSDATMVLYDAAAVLAQRSGWEVGHTAVGGASDGNFVSALGRPVLDGLGAVGAGAHARHEHVIVSDMATRAGMSASLLAAFAPA